MSSQFLTFIFIILVSVQISSCGWGFPWKNGKEEKTSTESTTVKNLKDDEPNSPSEAAIIINNPDSEEPKEKFVLSVDNNEDESSRESSAQSTKTTLENVSPIPNEEPDEYSEEDSSKFPNSGKEIKWIPTTSTNSTDKIVNYVSSVSTQITVSSTTEESESESSTIDNSNTSTSTENTLNGTDVNNVPRNVDEDRDGAEGISSVVSSSTIPSSLENSNFEIESVSNSSEFISPEVTYAPNVKDVSSSIDEEKEPTSDKQSIERKDKETHSPRNVTDKPDYSTQKTTFEDYEIGNSSTAMTNMPTTSENTLNYTSNNEARNVIDDTENSGNSSKSETVSDLDPSASMQANTTIETILSTSTATMNTTEMAGPMSNGTTPEVNFGSFVNSGSTSNTYSQLILNLCILIFSISVIV